MAAWLEALAAAERDNQPAVLVTVLAARGSTPREAGAKMVVTADGLAGTIGGGNLEHQCEMEARVLLAGDASAPVTHDFPLGPALGQCCGGHVTVLFEPLRPPDLQVALFGAGHVGKALIKLLADLPCRVRWIDPRPEALPAELPPNVLAVRTAEPHQVVAGLPTGSVALVMTHDHQLDFEIVTALLRRPDLRLVGLIGSATKRARFTSRLSRLGVPASTLERLVCPIGVPGIDGKQPAIVAVAVAAQILQLQTAMRTPAPTGSLAMSPTLDRPGSAAPALDQQARRCGDCVCAPGLEVTR